MYYSRIMPSSGPRYITSTAVFLTEVVKFGICMTVALFEMAQEASLSTSAVTLFQNLASAVFSGDSWKLAIPAALYTIQHSLQYIAISHLDAATLQVTYQFKILPTAIFSILILRRSLTTKKWLALALLMFGVALVQFPTSQYPAAAGAWHEVHKLHFPRSMEELRHWRQSTAMSLNRRSATYEGIEEDMLIQNQERDSALGLAAAILSCSASALGSVYFEKVLKEATGKVSIWIRNVQLSIYSIVPSLFIGVIFVDGENISKNGFFVGYNWIVWQVITLQALGGILVALAIHYTNNIAKSFATSLSILLSLCLSMIFFDFTITLNVSPLHLPLPLSLSNNHISVHRWHHNRPLRNISLQYRQLITPAPSSTNQYHSTRRFHRDPRKAFLHQSPTPHRFNRRSNHRNFKTGKSAALPAKRPFQDGKDIL